MTATTATTVPRSVFSVDGCPPGERYDYWRHSIAAIFDVDATPDVVDDFHATIDSHLVGPLLLARTCSRRQHWVRSSRTVARDGMDHYMIQLFESGGQTVRTGGESRAMSAGQLIVCDLQRTMDNDTTDFRNLSILFPRPLLESQLECPDAVHGLIIDGATSWGQILTDLLSSLKHAAESLSAGDVQAAAENAVGVTAACLNGIGRAAAGKAVAPPPASMPRIKRHIMENLHDPALTPQSVGSQHGITPMELHDLFEPEGGFFTYLRVVRLKAAFDALRDPHQLGRSMRDIAVAAGYGSDAFFCRAFESMFGVTPGDVRKAAEMAVPAFTPQPGVDRRYEGWLRGLSPITAAGRP